MPLTPFQKRVYEATAQIPRGCVTTYKLLGDYLNCGGYQAVGQALRRNPFAPEVPCHRVIASDLSPGGYGGERGGERLAKKLRRLEEEGVRFSSGRLADTSRIHIFTSPKNAKLAKMAE